MAQVAYLLDTNILLRLLQPRDADYALVRAAVEHLRSRGATLCFTLQGLAEFWGVCTRPTEKNGYGLSVPETDRRARVLESAFTLLSDNERVYPEWRRLALEHGVTGVQVHDARLVASMLAHGISHLLTLNDRDFVRFTRITAVHPAQAAGGSDAKIG
jgi:predicted nucleic acid-binding protein